jgi:lysophospholipase L1-like esterase
MRIQRLQANGSTKNLSVLDEGIGGNRVLRDGTGPSALARFDRDVLAQAGVKYVIILESINDIGRIANKTDPESTVTAQDLEQGLQQLAARAHEHGIKVFGATLTPYQGAGYSTDRGEQVREAINQWIRTSGVFDGVIDFEKAVEDPANPLRFLPRYDHGGHLHPNDVGYRAMGDAVDLNLFK